MMSSRTTPVIHVTSRGRLYAPKNSTRSRWAAAAITMKLVPKEWSPRTMRPNVTSLMMNRTLSYA